MAVTYEETFTKILIREPLSKTQWHRSVSTLLIAVNSVKYIDTNHINLQSKTSFLFPVNFAKVGLLMQKIRKVEQFFSQINGRKITKGP